MLLARRALPAPRHEASAAIGRRIQVHPNRAKPDSLPGETIPLRIGNERSPVSAQRVPARRTEGSEMDDDTDVLGWRYWLGFLGIAVAAVIGLVILFVVVGSVWYTWGFLGMFLVLAAVLIGFGYLHDRREQRQRRRLA